MAVGGIRRLFSCMGMMGNLRSGKLWQGPEAKNSGAGLMPWPLFCCPAETNEWNGGEADAKAEKS